MEVLALIISIIALIIAISAYFKVGGRADLRKQTEALTSVGETIVKATDSLRDKTADILDRMEGAIRGAEDEKGAPKTGAKRRAPTRKQAPRAEKRE
ncbi:MAG: hypothetical protein JSW12_17915 [Deltaproteobacteria bacterium]|nr:MAG: hypothetical protein JSW12_17915 [Deltaproteobacteria bacterium]